MGGGIDGSSVCLRFDPAAAAASSGDTSFNKLITDMAREAGARGGAAVDVTDEAVRSMTCAGG
ncbi:hypothetical protein M8A51_18890 [Schlegelella sp. S2-27]|uniref:Uncharacterized protein n=1 Tax=Caldimonas mangrovi TaxID=2944811 RepID=A0ABT0YS82_9BURK|nr:hypothetical protein [Caldimonas mangrovi]MCM5681597.1 hypothetical protein [Caldimonas mangrovi]